MAAPVLRSGFVYSQGRKWLEGTRPSVIVFYIVWDGRGMASPVLLSSFRIVEDGRSMAAPVLLSSFFCLVLD